ncbi:Glycerol-3-phosphate dehydrogenase [Sarcoptes scabiei]|uniref:Glycerol-3-phosphate dehydrogenase n=2 Tax=Sarcoptes scabiei TaxID=52283 RepID=A0A834R5R2_SARSC|nr:Glycerol-3-phosphate dehydrogenase [Sarcoptes scabiei]
MAWIGISRVLFLSCPSFVILAATTNYFARKKRVIHAEESRTEIKRLQSQWLPPRSEMLMRLKQPGKIFDVLVIGGGATGCGVALDSTTRGLSTALIELNDFSSGTSSRSTKLIHGGVRYLQKAIFNLDYDQYRMVREALQERANLLEIAPHLSSALPIMLPIYKWWQVPYFWAGIKAYDFVAGQRNLKSSYFLSKKNALELFPMLKSDSLKGAVVYYDGQHNDARMNLAIALSAARYGATVANHVAVIELKKNPETGRLIGARLKDLLSNEEWDVEAKVIINATGPFTDSIRKMNDSNTRKICQPSIGVHIVLPGYYSPSNMGLLDPATSDGRVIFFLPWEKWTIAGTTDRPCEVTHQPSPTEQDIQFILNEIRHYLSKDIDVRRGDVMSAWAGIRPLVLDPLKPNTESIARNHVIDVCNQTGLITVAGGKWTTYRIMAQEAIDAAVRANPDALSHAGKCATLGLKLEGGEGWTPTMHINLVQDYGLEEDVAMHLAQTYGDKAYLVAGLAAMTGKRWPVVGRRLHTEFPYLEAEVRYAIKEYACTAIDVIARRTRLAFLNVQATEEVLPKIVQIMSEELKWNKKQEEQELQKAREFLNQRWAEVSINCLDLNFRFQYRKGYIGINDLRRSMTDQGIKVTDEDLHLILSEVDLNQNGRIEFGEYLELMSCIKNGLIVHNRFARAFLTQSKISVERSGGGV